MTPDTLLMLANLTVPRRPDRGPTVYRDPLASPATAAQALSLRRVETSQLGALLQLHRTVVDLVNGLLTEGSVRGPAARLTKLALPSTATARLEVDKNQTLHARLDWNDPSPAATLARKIAFELGEIELTRLRRCERSACDLLFYDTTRSGTRRWHAESPCGNRERQRRHRGVTHVNSPAEGR
jgi:predicted RNA-binding Zn ribbon-like protein